MGSVLSLLPLITPHYINVSHQPPLLVGVWCRALKGTPLKEGCKGISSFHETEKSFSQSGKESAYAGAFDLVSSSKGASLYPGFPLFGVMFAVPSLSLW